MTDKPETTIEKQLEKDVSKAFFGHTVENSIALEAITQALTQAYARGRRDGLEEAAKVCDESPRPAMWSSDKIRALKEKGD